jgi:membrane-bound serine protease (ClpP class)
LDVEGIIHPIIAEYVEQGLHEAAVRKADAVLIHMSTPGGLDTAMRDIIRAILASPCPVIVWVGPSGTRAASAGFLILLSADVAAMAPGTNTGAAHPVLITGGQMDEVMKKKVENDAAAYLRSIATQRGRNAELAEKGILESKSFSEQEALKEHLIDLIAASPEELLQKLDGRSVRRFQGDTVTLHLVGATIQPVEPSTRQRLLSRIVEPNLALILLALGALGLYVEFTHPGLIAPGVAGAILLIMGLFAFSLLPINWTGALLIICAFVFFILEAKFISHGVLTAGGIVSLVLGSLILVNSPVPEMRVNLLTALSVAIPFGLITVFLLRLAIQSQRAKVVTGAAGLLDEVGTVQSDLAPEGQVFVQGEIWKAVSATPVLRGGHVKVRAVEGLKLRVEPVEYKP